MSFKHPNHVNGQKLAYKNSFEMMPAKISDNPDKNNPFIYRNGNPAPFFEQMSNNQKPFMGQPLFLVKGDLSKAKENQAENCVQMMGAKEPILISVKIDQKHNEKSEVLITGALDRKHIEKEEFLRMIDLLKLVNFREKPTEKDIYLPSLLIEIFIRILIKKKFIFMSIQNFKWSPKGVETLMATNISKKKEESLKYVIRETFTILTDKYRSLHYYYWHSINPSSSLKIERELNYYVGFTRFYFGELMKQNYLNGVADRINNYTLPNKKNGNLKSNNKSITPQFLKRLFQSPKFYTDFMTVLESPADGLLTKTLRNVLYKDSEHKLDYWIHLYQENKTYDKLAFEPDTFFLKAKANLS